MRALLILVLFTAASADGPDDPNPSDADSSPGPVDWERIDGSAREVCIRGHDGPIMRISDDGGIYSRTSLDSSSPDADPTWTFIKADAQHCSTGFDGSLLYTDNKDGWHRQVVGNVTWRDAPASASKVGVKQLSARNYYELAGVDTKGNLWHFIDDDWRPLAATGTALGFGIDGALYLLAKDKTLWAFDWTKRTWGQTVRTGLRTLDVYSRNRIIYTTTDDATYVKVFAGTWTKIDKTCRSSAINEFDIFCVDRDNTIWRKRFIPPCDAACKKS